MAYDSTSHFREHAERLTQQRAEFLAQAEQDPELLPLVQEELAIIDGQLAEIAATLKSIETAAPAHSAFTNCIMEIRSGAGGDEAKIWAEDLMNMYARYAERKGLRMEALDAGVVKFIGKTAYDTFRLESGVHRVQRVPATENQGRIHTSTASVAVLPEIPEQEITIREEDLEWQFTRAGGKGGQNVNKVNTAVLLRHTPSGLMITSRQERSQEQNRVIALGMLRGKLWELQEAERIKQLGDARSVIGRADRSEKIRTYNYSQNRLTDHRIPRSWYSLDLKLLGDLDEVIQTIHQWEKDPDSALKDAPDTSDDHE